MWFENRPVPQFDLTSPESSKQYIDISSYKQRMPAEGEACFTCGIAQDRVAFAKAFDFISVCISWLTSKINTVVPKCKYLTCQDSYDTE